MLTLFHAPRSPSSRIVWLLEELQAEYRLETVNLPQRDGSKADPKNPHPHGYTPALVHDGALITETGAITLYLTDLYPNSTVGVPLHDPLRARYVTWLFYQVGLTEPLFYMKGTRVLQSDDAMSRLYLAMMRNIEETLGGGPFMLGERFTAVDILYMSLFEHSRALLGKRDRIEAYCRRGLARPARQRALSKDG
ncbi:MAG TPA: glutathione S-transferase family protein [Steroidobacteraceae bacterium]|jgi:glutathione S-transferase|nr:glutathione S-transferase family protein [Steroidobacteraceae bacterium]